MISFHARMRAPIVSLCFFAAVPLFLVYAAWESAYSVKSIRHNLQLEGREILTNTHNEKQDKTPLTRQQRILQMAESASSQAHFQYSFNALDPLLAVSTSEGNKFNPKDEYFGLPRYEGYELVSDYCSACHSLRIVMQQRASIERWQDLLVWMSEKQGMARLEQDEERVLVKYLAENFGTE